MKTPICDFVREYIEKNTERLHMPGHKGISYLGMEKYDLTEIKGADSLFEAEGIIAESEKNASELFGADTFYSTEGSSHCIRAMLYLVTLYAKERGEKPYILATRNVHKTFLSGIALLDIEVDWLYPLGDSSYLSCIIDPTELEKVLGGVDKKPTCVYITSPDYLGNMCDIRAISRVCRKYGVLLLVDNAHGAYLKFTGCGQHPMDSGADICCDSAHKTLPSLTGGAYIHINKNADPVFKSRVRDALALFGSTSPSYLILQSLDAVNKYIEDGYQNRLWEFIRLADRKRAELTEYGYSFIGDESLKFTLDVKKFGYTGIEFADIMRKNHNIECEFCDPDYIVFMLSPDNNGLTKLSQALMSVAKGEPVLSTAPAISRGNRAVSVREAVISPWEEVPTECAKGRILAVSSVSCPPAVPILVPGEIIDDLSVDAFIYYGIKTLKVIK
ncbi:MAG: aminotransferase class I/II-fold pyridoxal phosphate-dependent enzyme [Clostridia bacterium]|nr:aminotransferase class I/II-fold pyridoxal phosphate-dependent enzyme [Clostridia bacterium]